MIKKVTVALIPILVFSCLACAPAPAIETPEAATAPSVTMEPTAAPTPEPTVVPTPEPTPEPVVVDTAMSEKLFTSNRVTATLTGVHFSENDFVTFDLSINNASAASVSVKLDGTYLNDWQVEGLLADAEQIAGGETRVATVIVNFANDPNAVYRNITALSGFTLDFSVVDDASGKNLASHISSSVVMPDAVAAVSPVESATLVYEDNSVAVYLQGIDGKLQNTRAILYKKPKATWKSVTVDPVYAGYTNIVNQTYTLDTGKYLLLALDGTEVMTRQNITALSQLDLYLTLAQSDGRLNRPVRATITDPNVAETVSNPPDAGPIVYQSELSYFILRNMGVTQYDGHEALLLDFENITQNYLKQLDITAYASNPRITIDGVAYPLLTYCTNCYPTTHGYLLLWADGAPEGTLTNAKSVSVGLKISRINAGRLDPIVDTGNFTIDLQ